MVSFRSKCFLSWFLALLLCCGISTCQGQLVGTNCSDPRIRKSWDALSKAEKTLYLDAVGVAMKTGYYQKFLELHTDPVSGYEAHRNCMFIYWHRLLLLGFENMLRSLNDKYRCITVPYWDHVAAKARNAAYLCSDLDSCSPIIKDTGGTTVGVKKNLVINSTTIPSSTTQLCITNSTLGNFCGTGTTCAKCVVRKKSGSLTTPYPGAALLSSVYSQVFSYNDLTNFAQQVERNVHNMVHNALGGTMSYFEAPADPVFYSHHSFVDLLQTIYLKCQNGKEGIFLSDTTKSSDPRFWQACTRTDNGVYTPLDTVTMHAKGETLSVWENSTNVLYPFFKDVPHMYTQLVDAKDLVNYSYTYQISGGMANMYTNCKDSNTLTAATDTTTTSLLTQDDVGKNVNPSSETKRGDYLRPTLSKGSGYEDQLKRWSIALYEAARIVGYEEWAAREQMEMITCQFQQDCLGGVADYSDLFRKNFGVEGHPRCYTIVEEIQNGDLVIGVPNWKGITTKFLPCDKYKPQTQIVSSFVKAFEKAQESIS